MKSRTEPPPELSRLESPLIEQEPLFELPPEPPEPRRDQPPPKPAEPFMRRG